MTPRFFASVLFAAAGMAAFAQPPTAPQTQPAADARLRFENDQSKYLDYLRSKGKTRREDARDRRNEDGLQQLPVAPADDQVHIRLISLFRSAGETDASLNEKADKILERFRAGEKFGDLAREFTQGPTKSKGGDYGWMQRSSFQPEFSDIAFNLRKGEASAPLIVPSGCYIIYAEDRRYAESQQRTP